MTSNPTIGGSDADTNYHQEAYSGVLRGNNRVAAGNHKICCLPWFLLFSENAHGSSAFFGNLIWSFRRLNVPLAAGMIIEAE